MKGRTDPAVDFSASPPSYAEATSSKGIAGKRFLSWLGAVWAKLWASPFEVLRKYDTVILVDDSGSMNEAGTAGGTRWMEVSRAGPRGIGENGTKYDSDGIDIHFLNHTTPLLRAKSAAEVKRVFDEVSPEGGTPTGQRLTDLLNPVVQKLESSEIRADGTPEDKVTKEAIKPVNFIVITDGAATDNPSVVVIDLAKRLKALRNICKTQVGIQFIQIGNDSSATRNLQQLDDRVRAEEDVRDIVDTTPYAKLHPITGAGLIKALLGGIDRRIDAQS
ncbi:hypothetical protein B0H14DRAFT_2523636 [Mycena olivaceomarginata]|nr:hypothetical protein B0H14DRAFT_2523636 [Mycena olivaceomarginata]